MNENLIKKLDKKIFVIFLIFGVIVLGYSLIKYFKQFDFDEVDAPDPLEGCLVLADDCKDPSCDYLFLCNKKTAVFSECAVYDCGDYYEAVVLDNYGNSEIISTQKADQEKVLDRYKNCQIEVFEVVSRKRCVDGSATAKVKIETQGECEITGFDVTIDNKTMIASFDKQEDYYNVSAGKCGYIKEITAIGKGGITIK